MDWVGHPKLPFNDLTEVCSPAKCHKKNCVNSTLTESTYEDNGAHIYTERADLTLKYFTVYIVWVNGPDHRWNAATVTMEMVLNFGFAKLIN